MSSSAGKVLILPKGEYNNATQYQMLDAVRYNGSLYIAKKTTIGHVPADGEYWMLSAIGASDVHWGDITGSIANQSDLINALDAKQNVLTFDSTPTASSNNPVTSAGIKTALDTKQNTLTFDTTPTSGSTNPVTSEGIHTAVQATASNLATIESSTTASQAYSEGDYLVLNGQLYEVIADIASGETLTVGTNISATTVGSELTALNTGLMNVEILSYDERKVGTWVNGKPLYRKGVLINSLPNATGSDYPHGISNVDTIYADFGNSILIFPSGNCASFNYIGGNSNATVEVQYVTKTVIHIDAHSTDRRSAKAIIFLKYTKTTD